MMNAVKFKTSFFFIIALFSASPCLANTDTYKSFYEQSHLNLNTGLGYSNSDNLTGLLAWDESYLMMSFLTMYQSTGSIKYLETFVTHANNVINQRDDFSGRFDYRNISAATWITTSYGGSLGYAFVAHSGMITYPLADFVLLIINTPSIQNHVFNGKTLLQVANVLKLRVSETIIAHEDQWDDIVGTYRFRPYIVQANNYPTSEIPMNMNAAMGRMLLTMYLVTENNTYLNKVIKLANRFKKKLRKNQNAYDWSYWYGTGSEDIAHATLNFDFAYLCYKNNIVFNQTDMHAFSSTFIKFIYLQDNIFAKYINGTSIADKYFTYSLGLWLPLSEINWQIYAVISKFFDTNIVTQFPTPMNSLEQLLGTANLIYYQRYQPVRNSSCLLW